jgi:type IV pilus assembly protein PilB
VKRDLPTLLVEHGVVTQAVLDEAVAVMANDPAPSPRRLVRILADQFKVDADALYREVASFYAFRTLDVEREGITDDRIAFIRAMLEYLPPHLQDRAADSQVLPFTVDAANPNRLLLVSPDPTRREVYEVAKGTGYKSFEICFTPPSQWQDLWRKVVVARPTQAQGQYSTGAIEDVDEEEDAGFEREIEQEISRSGLITLIDNILVDGVRVGASDIHVIPRGEKISEFHFRIDGKLTLWLRYTEARTEAVSAVLKDRAKGLDRFERNMAQDGFAQMLIDGKTIRFRVSVLPTVGKELKSKHESIVIRILQEPNLSIRIEDLGFNPQAEKALRKAIAKPHGIIIVTGPTGSGKSTTLVAALRAIMDPAYNILTVEDPVEYFIDGARQIKLNPKLDFEGALRAILRHDPDIVMVGEMRDRITAEIAIKLANTGHLTFSTLHTNDSVSVISRLMKMGVEPFLIAYAINLVVAQRLMRRLCPRCKAPLPVTEFDELRALGLSESDINNGSFFMAVGCSDCIGGYRGRRAIHEALYFTKDIRKLIMQSDTMIDDEKIRDGAARGGMLSLRQAALNLLKEGVTSVEEVVSVTSEED